MVNLHAIRWIRAAMTVVQLVLLLGITRAAYHLIVPPSLPPAPTGPEQVAATRPTTEVNEHPLAWYAPLWQRDLRQPPVPPAARKPTRRRTPKPEPLRLTLLGTVIELDARYAVFRNGQGRMVVKRIRERIDEFTIARIDRGLAELTRGPRTVIVKVPNYESLHLEEIR